MQRKRPVRERFCSRTGLFHTNSPTNHNAVRIHTVAVFQEGLHSHAVPIKEEKSDA